MANPKILCVDDETCCLDFFVDFLPDDQYDLYFAKNGREALHIVDNNPPDLIFLDMRMPVLDGLGFLGQVGQQFLAHCPVVAITGYSDEDVITRCYEQGIVSFVHKPLRGKEIKALADRYTKLIQIKNDLRSQWEDMGRLLNEKEALGNLHNSAQVNLFEAIPVPFFILDQDLIFRKINEPFARICGLCQREILGKDITEIPISFQTTSEGEIEKDIFISLEPKCSEGHVTNGVGQHLEIILHQTVVKDIDGAIIGLLGVMIDLSGYGLTSFSTRLISDNSAITSRECQVANWVRIGISNKEIAERMNIALSTVEFHRNNLREKLNLKGRKINLRTFLLSLGGESPQSRTDNPTT